MLSVFFADLSNIYCSTTKSAPSYPENPLTVGNYYGIMIGVIRLWINMEKGRYNGNRNN